MDRPNMPRSRRVNNVRPRAVPHAPPPEYSPSTPRMSAGPAALDHGVPGWRVWKMKDGNQVRNVKLPTKMGARQRRWFDWLGFRPPLRKDFNARGLRPRHPRLGN